MSDSDKIKEFQSDFLEVLKKHDVGIYGTMYFRIGDEELVLDTTTPPEGEEVTEE